MRGEGLVLTFPVIVQLNKVEYVWVRFVSFICLSIVVYEKLSMELESKMILLAILMLTVAATSVVAGSLIAPWTPVNAKGNTISCWGRSYRFDGNTLPSSIVSQRENILASPIELAATVGGKRIQWKKTKFKLIKHDAETAVFETSSEGGGIKLKCSVRVEFDGTAGVDMALDSAKPVLLDSLDLIVPMKAKYAALFHHSSVYPIHVWDWPMRRMNSGAISKDGLKLPYVFHLWVGNDDLGLQVFSETDEAWSPKDPESAITVMIQGSVALLKMNILNNYKLEKEWKWTWGFVASPVKPWPKDYYDLHYCQMGGYGIENSVDGKPALLDVYKDVRVNWLGFHENWSDEQSLPRPQNPKELESLVKGCQERGIRLATYTGCYMSTRSPEYQKEWDSLPIGDHYQYERPDNKDICRIVCNNTGYPDLLLKTYAEAMPKYGIDGIYMDGLSCPLPCINTKHGCGYIGKDGQVRPTMAIWKTRELMKGFYRLVKGLNPHGIIVSHTSSSVLLPALSFADVYLNGEHLLAYRKLGSENYPEDILRAEMSGHNLGIPGTQLPIRGDEAERERARTLCLLYDVLTTWGPEMQMDVWKAYDAFGMRDVTWIPFWKSESIVEHSGQKVRVSGYVCKGRGVLYTVGNLGDKAETVILRPLRRGIGVSQRVGLVAKDAVSGGSSLEWVDGALVIEVPANSFRMISVTTE